MEQKEIFLNGKEMTRDFDSWSELAFWVTNELTAAIRELARAIRETGEIKKDES